MKERLALIALAVLNLNAGWAFLSAKSPFVVVIDCDICREGAPFERVDLVARVIAIAVPTF